MSARRSSKIPAPGAEIQRASEAMKYAGYVESHSPPGGESLPSLYEAGVEDHCPDSGECLPDLREAGIDQKPRKDSSTRVSRTDRAVSIEMMKARGSAAKMRHEAVPVARIGIQVYRDSKGKPRRELRIPGEVFSQVTLGSLRDIQLYNGHTNVGSPTRESIGRAVNGRPNDSKTHLLMDIVGDEGKRTKFASAPRGLSGEYSCELDTTQIQELTDAYGEYHAIQRNIQYTGMALVDSPRCGPSCSLKMDCAECANKEECMDTEVEVTEAEAPKTNELERLRGENEQLRAQLAQQKRSDEEDAKAKEAEIRRIANKLSMAREILPLTVRIDGLTEHELDCRMLRHLSPGLKIDGASKEFVAGALAVALDSREKPLSALDAARGGITDPAAIARQKMIERNRSFLARTSSEHQAIVDSEHEAERAVASPYDAESARQRMIRRNKASLIP